MNRGYGYIAIALFFFGTFEVVLKFIAGQINPIQLTFTRFFLGFLVLLPMAISTLKKRGKRLDGKTMGYFAFLGLIGIAICMPMYQLSVAYLDSAVVAVLFSCNPVFVTFLAFLILGEPVRGRHIVALILEVLGTIAIINPLETKLNVLGVVLILTATVLFSFYGVMGKRKVAELGGPVVTCFGSFFGSMIMLLLILVTHIPAVADAIIQAGLPSFANIPIVEGYTLDNLPFVLYVSAGVAGLGFCAYFMAMEYQPASVVSLVYFFKPALSPILAWAVHGESIPMNMLLGICLIVVGSCFAIVPGVLESKRGMVFQRF